MTVVLAAVRWLLRPDGGLVGTSGLNSNTVTLTGTLVAFPMLAWVYIQKYCSNSNHEITKANLDHNSTLAILGHNPQSPIGPYIRVRHYRPQARLCMLSMLGTDALHTTNASYT